MAANAEVRPGRAWQFVLDREKKLQDTIDLLSAELNAVRELLSSESGKNQAAKESIEGLREELRLESEARCLLEGTAASLRGELAIANETVATLQQQLQERDSWLLKEKMTLTSQNEQICGLKKEIAMFQVKEQDVLAAQELAKTSNREIQHYKRKAVLAQKELEKHVKHAGLLEKENDRNWTELVKMRSELVKLRVKQQQQAKKFPVENLDPNKPRVEKLVGEKMESLARFEAPSRLKYDLSHQKALREVAERELERVRKENQSLKVRIWNFGSHVKGLEKRSPVHASSQNPVNETRPVSK